MKVFVTGHLGYVGVVLVELLKQRGHTVTGCDIGLFDGCSIAPFPSADRTLRKDIRDLTPDDLAGHDCVMHLAAISNDPMGSLDPHLTYDVNAAGAFHVAAMAKTAHVPRFVLASSCSIYGTAPTPVKEDSPLNPLSVYARSKVQAENMIGALADAEFCPTFLRFSTAFGYSPMLRIDLVANNLLACALATGKIRVLSDGTPWRPLIHVRDMARAFLAAAEAPQHLVFNTPINIGDAGTGSVLPSAHRVRDIAEAVGRIVPSAEIEITGETGGDPRSYQVHFGRLRERLLGFCCEYSLDDGLLHLAEKLVWGFSRERFEGPRFVRMRVLERYANFFKRAA